MKFSTREDIEAPIDMVFLAVSDFTAFERTAMRRGIEVERTDKCETPGEGMAWISTVPFRGKQREIEIEVATYAPSTDMLLNVKSGGISGQIMVELVPLSRNRTRLMVGVELRPETMPARLLLQSLKLAKSSLDKRFAGRVKQFGSDIESNRSKPGKPNLA